MSLLVVQCATLARVFVASMTPVNAAGKASSGAAPSPSGTADSADQANTPLPTKTQIQFKPGYTFAHGDTHYEASVLFEPILPYRAFLIPGLEVDEFWSIARLRWTGEGLQTSKGPSSGLTDLTLTNLVAHRLGPFNGALGYATVFPVATASALGQGKVQLGPAAALRLEAIPQLKLAALVQNLYSIAGSNQSPDLAYVTVQPFITVHLPGAMFLSSDATMKFYWQGGRSTVPVNIGLGHAFGAHFVGSVRGWYTVADADKDAVEVEVVLDFQPDGS
jgi:hypothetical protein